MVMAATASLACRGGLPGLAAAGVGQSCTVMVTVKGCWITTWQPDRRGDRRGSSGGVGEGAGRLASRCRDREEGVEAGARRDEGERAALGAADPDGEPEPPPASGVLMSTRRELPERRGLAGLPGVGEEEAEMLVEMLTLLVSSPALPPGEGGAGGSTARAMSGLKLSRLNSADSST